jgi:hypothetical protein
VKRLLVVLAAMLVLAPAAGANGPTPYRSVTAAPTGLHAFLLRPDEVAQRYYPRTPSFAWNPVNARGGTYEFELATSRSFNDSSVLFSYTKLAIPAVAIAHQLPWMTGVPYALWAHVRWVSPDGKRVTPWSAPFGFNMRWTDDDYPQQETSPEGLIRWKPIEGATRYEVLYPDINGATSFQTTTNVADEREFFTFHQSFGWSTIHWRVRAIRYIDDKDVLKNGLPRVSYGPWSKVFTTVNPPQSLGVLKPSDTVSDTWDKAGQSPSAHELTPGFAWNPSPAVVSSIGSFGSPLYRVYVFTDDHCVNVVFKGSIVGSPAFAAHVRRTADAAAVDADACAVGRAAVSDLVGWHRGPRVRRCGRRGEVLRGSGRVVDGLDGPRPRRCRSLGLRVAERPLLLDGRAGERAGVRAVRSEGKRPARPVPRRDGSAGPV